MAVVIDADVWEPNPALYIFLFASSLLSILCFPVNSNPRASNVLDHSLSPSLSRFRRNFIFLFSISSVMEGLWAVFGEYELTHYGVSKDQMVLSLCIGCVAALFVGSFLGILSDLIGQKKVCLLFFMLHLFVAIWKRVNANPSVWIASICLSLASSIFFFNFETWMVVEHEKQGLRQDVLNEMFWLMSLVESASFIGSQVVGNWLIADRRIWLLSWVQACVHFSSSVFWILWAPTMVADGREILLGLLYPCFLGARMLGSTAFPWFNGPLSLRTEEYLVYIFIVMGAVLSIVAFDYQEIEALLILFCIFHACVGLVLPSLARLRTMFVPNELRAGMMSLSLFPSNAALLFFLVQRSYCHNLENSTIIAAGALGLFTAAGCMHMLKRLGKQLHQDWHKS
nr:molybdate-anion transporter-like isoform X1 [Ipomoea batatas]